MFFFENTKLNKNWNTKLSNQEGAIFFVAGKNGDFAKSFHNFWQKQKHLIDELFDATHDSR